MNGPEVDVAALWSLPGGEGRLQAYVKLADGRDDVATGDEPYETVARATFRALGLNTGGVQQEQWHFCMKESWWISGPGGRVSTTVEQGNPKHLAQEIVSVLSPQRVLDVASA
jgi:hypothetical protein